MDAENQEFLKNIAEKKAIEEQKLVGQQARLEDLQQAIVETSKTIDAYKHILNSITKKDNLDAVKQKEKKIKTYLTTNKLNFRLRPEFHDIPLKEIVRTILDRNQKPMSVKQIATEAYIDDLSQREFDLAKASLNVALAHGVEKNIWQKISRGIYQIEQLNRS